MQTKHIAIISAASGIVAGAAVGYFVAEKRAQLKWQTKAEEEILSVKKHYGMIHDPNDYDTPEEAAEADRRRVSDYLGKLDELDYLAGIKPGPPPEEPSESSAEEEVVVVPDEFDKDYPYPVNSDEFFQDHDDYPKITIHYYEKDDILSDDREEVIDNRKELIGNCLKFKGYDKTEPDTVYVINHAIGAGYEVCYDPDAYQTIVMGIPFD